MRVSRLCRRLAGTALAAMLLLPLPACTGQEGGGAEQARIDKAVKAYADQQQAEQQKAIDAAVANRAATLLRDPQTPFLGNPEGDVTVVEFFDYTCPFCKAVEPRLQALLAQDENVKVVLKDFPILAPVSVTAAKAALASVSQGKYESFHHALIGASGPLDAARIFAIARDVGLDVERLRTDMEAPEIADHIIANLNLARALRITSTPTFIVNTHMITQPSAKIDFPSTVAAARAE